ncbi:MAG TPA: transposase [Burkholderiales bacterium]|nr:transposase [Burkholderiales bacterium]
MARHPRLIFPDIALHIILRGNNRQDCFHQDNDRLVYLAILRDLTRLRQCALHAYCLMTNHVHMLVTPSDAETCSLLMRDLARCYAAYFNRRYSRTGSLWERPFKSCLVESPAYVLNCYRYIERNPVRARMVEGPAAHPWSSYAGNSGARSDALLTPHAEYLALSETLESRHRAYRGLLGVADDPAFLSAMRQATDAGFPLIGDQLKAKLEAEGVRMEAGRPGPRPDAARDEAVGQLNLLTE